MVEEFRSEVPGSARVDPPQVILHFVCNSYTLFIFIRTKFIRLLRLRFAELLRTFKMLKFQTRVLKV